jgi:tRNA-(ms[2]io[6]A)-hydroxylase
MSAPALDRGARFAAQVPTAIADFLEVPTPEAWINWALAQQDTLLLDHANCEKKAASTALATLHRYPDRPRIVYRMSRLAREELRHFEQVGALLRERGIEYRFVAASRYARRLRAAVGSHEPRRLSDSLMCGAFIEARSCERFAALIPVLDEVLARFYSTLLASEARHFEQYLELAREADASDFEQRLNCFREIDGRAVTEADDAFSFHSGPPRSA